MDCKHQGIRLFRIQKRVVGGERTLKESLDGAHFKTGETFTSESNNSIGHSSSFAISTNDKSQKAILKAASVW